MTTNDLVLTTYLLTLALAFPVFYLAGKGWTMGCLAGKLRFARENFPNRKEQKCGTETSVRSGGRL